MKVKIILLFSSFFLIFSLAVFQSCVDVVEPEFDYQSDIVFIDAYALTELGISSVSIKRSVLENGDYLTVDVMNAKVQLENVNDGSFVDFAGIETGGYFCPPDFAVAPNESWKLHIELANGSKYESKVETVTNPVEIDNIEAEFKEEVKFDLSFNKFVPGHSIRIDFQDPAGEDNFYLWKYRAYEPLVVCRTCQEGILRNDICTIIDVPAWAPSYYDYTCETDCWRIRFGEDLPIFDDRLSDGQQITSREVTAVVYYKPQDILVEIQQLALTEIAYDYFKIINDLVGENGGLNAPPPAALLGNLFNPDNPDEFILGQFTAAAVSTKRIFIDRSNLLASPVDPDPVLRLEDCFNCPTVYPCIDSPTRTGTKPIGWPE